jgi:hypothetical protein
LHAIEAAAAVHVYQLGKHGHAADRRGQCEHLNPIRKHETRKLVARVERERARAQEGDAANWRSNGLGVITHRPAR